MGAAEQRQKSSKMASDLVKAGIWHGRRMTKPLHANYPKNNEIGSAAYRRRGKVVPPRNSEATPNVVRIHPSNIGQQATNFGVSLQFDSLGAHFNILRFTSHGLRKERVSLGDTLMVTGARSGYVACGVLK